MTVLGHLFLGQASALVSLCGPADLEARIEKPQARLAQAEAELAECPGSAALPNLGVPGAAINLSRNDVRTFRLELRSRQRFEIAADLDFGDVDLSLFDASGARVALSAQGGSTSESIQVTAQGGPMELEVRAGVSSRYILSGTAN